MFPQVVGTTQPGHSRADDDGVAAAHEAPPRSIAAVTCSSIRMPGTAKPETTVVRAGRGGVKYSLHTRFQAGKSWRQRGSTPLEHPCAGRPAASSTASISASTELACASNPPCTPATSPGQPGRGRTAAAGPEQHRVGDHRIVGAHRRTGPNGDVTGNHSLDLHCHSRLSGAGSPRAHGLWSDHPLNVAHPARLSNAHAPRVWWLRKRDASSILCQMRSRIRSSRSPPHRDVNLPKPSRSSCLLLYDVPAGSRGTVRARSHQGPRGGALDSPRST